MSSKPSVLVPRSRNRACIEVTAMWDDLVLYVRHLEPPCQLWLTEQGGAHVGGEIVVPAESIGAAPHRVIEADRGGVVRLVVPAACQATIHDARGAATRLAAEASSIAADPSRTIVLAPGMEARIELGRFALRCRLTHPSARIARAPWRPGLRSVGLLASVLLHLALGGCSYYARSTAEADGEPTEEQRYLIQHYLDAAAEAEMAAKESEPVEEIADPPPGGTGSRAKGEQGAMGQPASRLSALRYGVSGQSDDPDPHASRATALREAADFGMIGLMNSGAGGDPDAPTAPWGRDDSLGSSPVAARGQGEGSGASGQGFGAGGLGLSGFGLGGGGLGGRASPVGIGASPGATTGAAPWPTIPESAAQEVPIDPNGRFATTYRPGNGHLAAFDAAMARGFVPASARELVSEVGARYAPELAAPNGSALGYAIDLERSALPPGGGTVHLRVALRSSAAEPQTKARLSVHVALDTSGSMAGEPLARAKEAAQHLVDRLAPADEFSLTTFSSSASVVVPAGPVGPRRPFIKSSIAAAEAAGMTNIGEALGASYAEAKRRATAGGFVPVVMLLSDGQPTAGIHDRAELAFLALEAFQAGVQTSTFGLGTQFDPALMSAIASDGAGGYYYLPNADQISDAFRSELDQRLEPSATGVEVRIRLASDVTLLGVYGSRRLDARESAVERAKEVATDVQAAERSAIRRDRQHDRQGGMRFFIPAFGRDDSYSLLVKLSVPAGTAARSLGDFELRYKDLVYGTNAGEESPMVVSFAESDADSVASTNRSVARTVQGHLAGQDLLAASQYLSRGQSAAAIDLIRERQAILTSAAASLGEPGFRTDAARFTRLLGVLRGDEPLGEPFAVAMVLETAARSHLQ